MWFSNLWFLDISEKLDKEVKKNIINRAYSRQELDRIYSRLKEEVDKKKFGLNIVKVVVIGTPILFFVLPIIFPVEREFDLVSISWSSLLTFLVFVGLYFFVRYLAIGKLMKQFNKAIKKGYPELSDTLNLK